MYAKRKRWRTLKYTAAVNTWKRETYVILTRFLGNRMKQLNITHVSRPSTSYLQITAGGIVIVVVSRFALAFLLITPALRFSSMPAK